MFAVIFEVEINQERKDEYLKIASILKEQLVNQKGFISVERFQSLIDEKNFYHYHTGKMKKLFLLGKKILTICLLKKKEESLFLKIIK